MNHQAERGQAALFMSMTLVVTLGVLGLVVDEGWAYWRKEACQTAAQAAAMSAASYATTQFPTGTITCNTSGVLCQGSTNCATNLTGTPANNFQEGCMYAAINGFTPGTKQNVTISSNITQSSQVSGVTTAYQVMAVVTEKVPLTFLSVVARTTSAWISSNATAGVIGTAAGSCIYVLDPSSADALNASNGAQIHSSCGVWVDSNSPNAILVTGSANITTTGSPQPPIKVDGGRDPNINGGTTSPAITTGAGSTANPLSSLEIPWCAVSGCATTNCEYTGCTNAAGVCDHTSQVNLSAFQATPYVLSPGVYCGGISVSNGNSITFNPGMYVINGGGVNIGSGSLNTGAGVIFYLTGTNATYAGFTIANGVSATLSAPTSGGLAGVLVYQNPQLTPTTSVSTSCSTSSPGASSIAGGSNAALTGVIYLPTTTVGFSNGTASSGAALSLVVKDAIFCGGATYFASAPNSSLAGSGNKAYLLTSN